MLYIMYFCVHIIYDDYFTCRVYEKIMEKMQEIGSTITGLKKTLADWAKKKGLEGNLNFLKKYVYLQ